MLTRLPRHYAFAILCSACALAPAASQAAKCTYSTTPSATQLTWTAYKFTSKKAVSGTFSDITFKGAKQASSLAKLLEGTTATIDASSVKTGNAGRNVTIAQFFFAKLSPAHAITATLKSISGNDGSGTANIEINLNGASKTLPFAYTIRKDGTFTAQATMDMFAFGLQPIHATIHRTCIMQHTGPDGVSKTWTDVALKLSGRINKQCS